MMRILSNHAALLLSLMYMGFFLCSSDLSADVSVRYLEALFIQVEIKKDIQFSESRNFYGKNEKLFLDLYSPPADDTLKNRPVILWIHGGGFRYGNDKTQGYIVQLAEEFAKRGFVCVSIDYRLRNDPQSDKAGTVNDAMEDAMAGLNWIRNNSEALGIDKNRIFIGGGSAGGRVAVNLCFKDDSKNESWDKSGIIGLINLWGSPDDSWKIAGSPLNCPPAIIIHGTDDETIPFFHSEELAKELKQSDIKCKLVPIPGAGHTPLVNMDLIIDSIAQFLFQFI